MFQYKTLRIIHHSPFLWADDAVLMVELQFSRWTELTFISSPIELDTYAPSHYIGYMSNLI